MGVKNPPFILLNSVLLVGVAFVLYQFISPSRIRYTIQNEISGYSFSITNTRLLQREIERIFIPPWDFYTKETVDQITIKLIEGDKYDSSQFNSQVSGKAAVLTIPLFTNRLPERASERNAYVSRVILDDFYLLGMSRIEFSPDTSPPVIIPFEDRQALLSLYNMRLERGNISFMRVTPIVNNYAY